ncbi:MAG: DNA-processing protein DprA [Patescibacteria group bacterium]
MIQNSVIYRDGPEYPRLLKKIGKEAPKQLYYKSSCPEFSSRFTLKGSDASRKIQDTRSFGPRKEPSIFDNCLAVVGSRKLTGYGRQAGEQLVSQIAAAGITIVSGFMYGGDALAHESAVKAGGRTIAVMPCGIDLIHPEHQKKLYQEILDNNGLVISEYEAEMQPALWTYPQRNRIVAGLCQALLVLEAGEKSGSLITANYAKKFKRKIFALPGPIISSVSKGTNLLIKQGLAELVTEAEDILRYYRESESFVIASEAKQSRDKDGIAASPAVLRGPRNDNSIDKQILELLAREPLGIDELSRDLGITSSDLGVKLSLMEMRGMIRQRGNKYYIKNLMKIRN